MLQKIKKNYSGNFLIHGLYLEAFCMIRFRYPNLRIVSFIHRCKCVYLLQCSYLETNRLAQVA